MTRVVAGWRAVVCALRGHAVALEFAQGRLWWRCTFCLHEGEGWYWTVAPAIGPRVVRFRQRERQDRQAQSRPS